MKIRLIRTGNETEVNDSYGLRLMEQGMAVLCQEHSQLANDHSGPQKEPAETSIENSEEEQPAATKKSRKKSG